MKLHAAFVLAVAVTLSCSQTNTGDTPVTDGGTTTSSQDAGGVVLKPNVLVLADSVVASATITATSITFPAAGNESLASVSPGTVIVSGYHHGFLRRVQSVSSPAGTQSAALHTLGGGGIGSIVFSTVAAALTDAVLSGSFDWTYAPPAITADATDLFAGSETAGISVSSQGNIGPSLEVMGQISGGSVVSFVTIVTTTVSDTVSTSLMFDASNSWSGSVPIPGASTTQDFVRFLGPVPVVGTLSVSVAAGYTAGITARANVSVGETCSVTHSDTITYDASVGWSSDDGSTSSCMTEGPTLDLDGGATASIYLAPTVQLSFYGIGGPSLSAQVGAEATITACPGPSTWSTDAFVSGSVGANVSVLGISKQFSKMLGKATYPIASGEFDTPSVCCSASTCPTGCCDNDGVCQDGSSVEACGTGGSACATCSGSDPTCTGGACVCGSDQTQCGTGCCDSDETCGDPDTNTCCDSGDVGCGGTCCGNGQVCADATMGLCCNSDDTPCGSACCSSGSTCQDPTTSTCSPCPTGDGGTTECGTACCSADETCADFTTSLCCNSKDTPCGSACCSNGRTCTDPATSTCSPCPTGDAGTTTECGTACCTADQTCADSTISLCCDTGSGPVCGSACCASGETCANPTAGLCCGADTGPMCGSACCSVGDTCADAVKGICCPTGGTVCGSTCCDLDHICNAGACVSDCDVPDNGGCAAATTGFQEACAAQAGGCTTADQGPGGDLYQALAAISNCEAKADAGGAGAGSSACCCCDLTMLLPAQYQCP